MLAFIRFSLNGDDGSLTTRLRGILEGQGFRNIGTSEYAHVNMSSKDLAKAMQDFWAAVENPSAAFPGVNFPLNVEIDHVWIHCSTL